MSWSYQFDEDFAVKYGLHEAIVFEKIRWWIRHNAANGQNQIDGKTWTFNTVKAWQSQFPFLTEKQVRKALENLRDAVILITAHHSPHGWDRTLSYALADETGIVVEAAPSAPQGKSDRPQEANGSAPEGQSSTTDPLQDNGTTSLAPIGAVVKKAGKYTPHEVKVFKAIGKLFQDRGGKWGRGSANPKYCWLLIDWAKEQEPDAWEKLLGALMGNYWAMKDGRMPGMTKSDKAFWERQPYTPMRMHSAKYNVLEYMRRPTNSPEAEASAAIERARARG